MLKALMRDLTQDRITKNGEFHPEKKKDRKNYDTLLVPLQRKCPNKKNSSH